jgi:zinc protease
MRPIFSSLVALAAVSVAACAPEAAPPPVTPPPAVVATAASAAPPAVATTPDEAFRAKKPDPLPNEPAFTLPVPVQRSLKNGAQVLVVENHAVPIVAVDVVIQSGVDREPLDRHGLSDFVADMLLEGTRTRSSLDIALARERLAAQLSAGSGPETTRVHLNALKDTLPDALALMADVLQNPAFKAEDIDRMRGLRLTSLAAKKGNPGALARDAFAKLVWGDNNPWGLPSGGTPESIKAITAKDLSRFHQTWFVPNNAVISVSGDVTADEAVAALEKVLGSWKKGKLPTVKPAPVPDAAARSIVFADLPTGTQSTLLMGWRAPKASSPDILALQVANSIVGGLFTSRLNLNLREQKAFTYGFGSRLGLYRDVSTFAASGNVVAAHTAESVTEAEKELARMKTDPIGDDELSRAKESLIRSLPSSLETNDAVASAMASLVELGRPLDYYATLPGRIRAIQKADVVAAVQKYFDPDHWPVVVVGPKSQSFDALKALGLGDVKEVTPANATGI